MCFKLDRTEFRDSISFLISNNLLVEIDPNPEALCTNIKSLSSAWNNWKDKQSVIRQKDESQYGCFKKTKQAKFSEKQTFLTPWYAHACVSGGNKCSFLENLACFAFLKRPFWNSPFCLIADETLDLNTLI